MPLIKGSSDEIISLNIKELRNTGKFSESQAVAIALKTANKHKAVDRAKKGVTANKRNRVEVKK